MSYEVEISKKKRFRRVGSDTYPQSVTLTGGQVGVVVASVRCETGLKPFLRKVANVQTDANAGSGVKFYLKVNGALWPNYESMTSEMSDPARPSESEAIEDELPQGANVQLFCDNLDGATQHTVVGRLTVVYEDLLP